MVCSSCGAENKAGRKFCAQCAAPLAFLCSACGAPNDPGDRFCGQCAAPLATGSILQPAPANATEGPAATGPVAERRLVSVLFADLVGFTPFAEERDAEEVRDTLSQYFDLATEVIARYGGTVEKFIGDAVMAVWGAPIAKEDDAERAVRAGLDLVDAVRVLGSAIGARAGILTGEAAVSLGTRNEGMVAGDLVNTAARLQSVAPDGAVLVGEATHRAASSAIVFEEVGEQMLKGKSSPVRAWRALRVVAQRGGQGRSDMPEPPFVGRDEEFRLLKDLVSATGRERKARLVSVTGPAGIGKSRLAWELEKYIDGVVEAIYWHRGRSPAYGEGITFWALGEMVRRRAGLAATDDEPTTRKRIAATVVEHVPDPEDRRWVEPALLTLLGLEPAPAGGRDLLFAAWRIFIERIAAKGTTILLFEDLQWADTGLLDFIAHLVEWSKGVPVLVVTLARPELFDRRPDWGAGMRNFTALALEPLSESAMHDLLAGFVPGLPRPVVDAILARADGVPLYAVETVRSLVADGQLQRVDGTYRPVGQFTTLAIPDTLRSLIASRLDVLDPIDRSLIQDASVLGQSFTLDGLAALSGKDEASLEPRLRGLVRTEILQLEADQRSPERGQYRFVQSLIREVAHGTLAKRDRRARHLAAAKYFGALGEDELAAVVATHYLAAYHASASGPAAASVAVQARTALRGAADRAATLGAHQQAVAYLKQALDLASDPAEKADLLMRAAVSADAGGSYALAEEFVRQAIGAYQAVDDQAGLARASALLGQVLVDGGQHGPAIDVLEGALRQLPESGVDVAKAVLLANLSRALFRHHEAPERAIDAADRALAIAERLDPDGIIAEAFINKGSALLDLGRRREGAAILEAAVRLAESGRFFGTEARARHNLGVSLFGDEPLRATEVVRGAFELSKRVGNRSMAVWSCGTLGIFAFLVGGDWDAVLVELQEATATAAAPLDLLRLLAAESMIRVSRGGLTEDLWARLEENGKQVSDLVGVGVFEYAKGYRALVNGDPASAHAAFVRSADTVPSGTGIFVPNLGRPGLWQRELEWAKDAAARLDADKDTTAAQRTSQIAIHAGIAALEGRSDEAAAGYGEALKHYRALGLDFELAGAALDWVLLLGPGTPEARAAADEARAIFERLGARPYLERLDAAMRDVLPSPVGRGRGGA